MSKDELKNFWWGYFLIFPCWWFFRWKGIGLPKLIVKALATPLVLLDLLMLAVGFCVFFIFLVLLAPRKLYTSLVYLWKKKVSEGDLVLGWITFFDFRLPWVKNRNKKIFCIGLPKTGTTSVHHTLYKAGYKTEHFPYMLVNNEKGKLVFNPSDIGNHDAISDLPVVAMLDELVKLYPDAYFIYTYRNKEKWLDSCRRHPWPMELLEYIEAEGLMQKGKRGSKIISSVLNNIEKLRMMHERVLGSSIYDREAYSAAYDVYEKKVNKLLEGKPNFLRLNIADRKDTKEKLGRFLGVEMKGPFEKKDCFYTWFFKKLTGLQGWKRILEIRKRHKLRKPPFLRKKKKIV